MRPAYANVSALERDADHGIPRNPGQDVKYVVVDDGKSSRDQVRLPCEAERHDVAFYTDLTIRASESVLQPLGWDRARIRCYLRDTEDTRLTSWE